MKTKTEKKAATQQTARSGKRGAPVKAAAAATPGGTREPGRELVDMAGAIAMLKTTRPTFYRWLRSGKLRGMKVGRQWRFHRSDVERFLQGEGPLVDLAGDLTPLLTALRRHLPDGAGPDPASTPDREDLQAVMLMIAAAAHMRASDLHIEPHTDAAGERVTRVRCRVDGVLHILAEFDIRLLRPIVERWKIMGGCNIHETRLPQDGRIVVRVQGRQLDLRVSFVPVGTGEAVTVRFLDSSVARLSLDRIEFAARDKERLLRFLAENWGLLVVSGPTGSGKTTVLYSCLMHCVRPEIKAMSVEDPVEYILPGVTQVQLRSADGLNFPAALRAVLRSDPDVILIGELRDNESLMIAQQCALTGHLVMTSMHAGDAAAALQRMVDMGSAPFLVADATRLVQSQRLVRNLCKACSRPCRPSPDLLARAGELAHAGGLNWNELPTDYREAVGCPECRTTGYRGRTVIVENLAVTPAIRAAICRNAPVEELRALAVKEGMTTFVADGIRRAAEGQTTLEEVLRVAGVAGSWGPQPR